MKTVLSIARFTISLFLAIQVWVWLRFLGPIWMSGNLTVETFETLMTSVNIFRHSIDGYLVSFIPAMIVKYVLTPKLSDRYAFFVYLGTGLILTNVHIMFTYGFSAGIYFTLRNGPVIIISGLIAASVFFILTRLFIRTIADAESEQGQVNFVRRRLIASATALLAGTGLLGSLTGPFKIWENSNKYIDVDLSAMKEDDLLSVEMGKEPIWIIKRSKSVIDALVSSNVNLLDEDSQYSMQPVTMQNLYRSLKPEYLVIYARCTHLGCLPEYKRATAASIVNNTNEALPQFFCPCHGGVFDLAGRVYRHLPPPENLRIPNYEFMSKNSIRIFFPTLAESWHD